MDGKPMLEVRRLTCLVLIRNSGEYRLIRGISFYLKKKETLAICWRIWAVGKVLPPRL